MHNFLMKTHCHLWKPVLKNKELSFMETIFENKACLSGMNSVFGVLFAKNPSEKVVDFGCHIIGP
jgi:hypothetical protein